MEVSPRQMECRLELWLHGEPTSLAVPGTSSPLRRFPDIVAGSSEEPSLRFPPSVNGVILSASEGPTRPLLSPSLGTTLAG
jgi:hypothetical protein